MKDEIIAAVAQGWCTKENENKTMDSTLAMAIVDNVMVVIEKLEATIAKHERREDSHVKRIEELISAKGIKELEARLAEAEREACAKTIELIIGVDVGWEDADTIRVAAKAIRKRGNE